MAETENSKANHSHVVKPKVTGHQTIFPLARVKKIAKHVPDVTLISLEVITAMSYVTEKFIEVLTEEAFEHAKFSGRKTVTRKDINSVIETSLPFQILEHCIDDLEEAESMNKISEETLNDGDDDDDQMAGPDDNDAVTVLEEKLVNSVEIKE